MSSESDGVRYGRKSRPERARGEARHGRGKQRRRGFRQILDDARFGCAKAAWDRAVLASRLRHAVKRSNPAAGRQLGDLKYGALLVAHKLAPLKVSLDDDRHVGLVTVRFPGHGSLHLPADAPLGGERRQGFH